MDVPCTGSGRWPRHPEAPWRLSETKLSAFNQLQNQILDDASRCVRPGGRLIYATCSVLEAENDRVVAAFLEKNGAFSGVSAPIVEKAPEHVYNKGCLALMPDSNGTDGFFCAILEKDAVG